MKLHILGLALLLMGVQPKRLGEIDTARRNEQGRSIRQLAPLLLKTKGNDGFPSSAFPLGLCEGDCDSDSDCAGNLKCFHRTGTQAVPGCSGASHSGTDYCYNATLAVRSTIPESSTTLTEYGNDGSPADAFPLGHCQGDCDLDSDCKGDLKCFQRNGVEAIPGCAGYGVAGVDYCYNATIAYSNTVKSSSLTFLGDNGNPGKDFPLGKCQGDCDKDSDCQEGLQCFQRTGQEVVPGCAGNIFSARDFCYDPADDRASYSANRFRLKIYWQPGYFWQEERFERKWCLDCGTSTCRVHTCGIDGGHFEFVKQSRGYHIKDVDTGHCLQHMEDSEVHILPCSSTESRQQWTGTFNSTRFELSPVDRTDLCVTTPHHPRDTEIVSCYRCDVVRTYDTTLWNKY